MVEIVDPAEATLDGIADAAASAVLYLAFLIVLILGRSAFRVPRRSKRRLATSTSQPELAKELLVRYGGSTISWMTTWPENRHMVTADGQSYLAFRKHAGVAVALGDPVGPPGSAGATIADFVGLCDRTALVPYLFSSSAATAAITDALGWQSAQVAEDNLIDLPGLEFKGKSWQDIRTALNRAGKEGITFRMVTLADEPWSMVRQVEDLSQQWLGDKGLPEMGFTLGGVPEALDRAVKVGLAVDEQGSLHGVLSWMPVYAGDGVVRGWTLDLMRRRDGGFRSVIEFLIASSCLHFQSEGAQFLSLSGAPLARSYGRTAGGHRDREVPGDPGRVAGAGLRIPLAARVQGEVQAAAGADVHDVPRRGRPAAHRHRHHPRLPAHRRCRRPDLRRPALNHDSRTGTRRVQVHPADHVPQGRHAGPDPGVVGVGGRTALGVDRAGRRQGQADPAQR